MRQAFTTKYLDIWFKFPFCFSLPIRGTAMKSTGKTFPWMSTAFWGLTLPILIVITISIENFPAMAADNSKPSGKVVRDFESGIHLDPFENMAMDRANYKAASFTGGATVLLFTVILLLVYNIIQRKKVENSLREPMRMSGFFCPVAIVSTVMPLQY